MRHRSFLFPHHVCMLCILMNSEILYVVYYSIAVETLTVKPAVNYFELLVKGNFVVTIVSRVSQALMLWPLLFFLKIINCNSVLNSKLILVCSLNFVYVVLAQQIRMRSISVHVPSVLSRVNCSAIIDKTHYFLSSWQFFVVLLVKIIPSSGVKFAE